MKKILKEISISILFLLSFSIPAQAAICLVAQGCTGVGTITGIPYGTGTSPLSIVTVGTGLSFVGGTLSATNGGTVTSIASADGSITITNPTSTVDLAVVKSPKLTTGRTISISGDLTYVSPSFDGSANVTAAGTLATVNSNVGSFTNASFTVNGKGLITAASSGTAPVTSVSGTTNRITSTGGATPVIDISASYIGQASITTLGTIGTGIWQGNPVGTTYGGTGCSSPSITCFNNITGYTASGATGTTSTNLVFSTSPTLITPALGTPTALVGTNITGTGSGFTSGITLALKSATTTVDVSASTAPSIGQVLTATDSTHATWQPASGGTGLTVGTTTITSGTTTRILYDNAGVLGEYTLTGSGTVAVMQNTPTLTTPVLGVATATSINKVAITAPATSATLTIADGKTATFSNSITLAGTDGKGINVGAATSGKFLIGDGTNMVLSTSTIPTSAGATANKLLLSDGTNYALSTPTFPNASATSGKIIKSDGTNWIASTETYAGPSTSGNVMTSDGTNWTSAAASTGGMWTKISTVTISQACADNTIVKIAEWTSLTGDTDDEYMLEFESSSGSAVGTTGIYSLRFNTDSATDYRWTNIINSSGTTIIASKHTGGAEDPLRLIAGSAVTGIDRTMGNIKIKASKTIAGTIRYIFSDITSSANDGTLTNRVAGSGSWTNTANELTSIQFNFFQNSGGSITMSGKATLYKINR